MPLLRSQSQVHAPLSDADAITNQNSKAGGVGRGPKLKLKLKLLHSKRFDDRCYCCCCFSCGFSCCRLLQELQRADLQQAANSEQQQHEGARECVTDRE